MLDSILKQLAGETVLNYPSSYEKGQSFCAVHRDSKGLEFNDTSLEIIAMTQTTTMLYVTNFEALPSDIIASLLHGEVVREFLDIHEDEVATFEEESELDILGDYNICYNPTNQKFYLFYIDSATHLSFWHITTEEVDGLPSGSHLFDFEEEVTDEEPLRAYALDGVLRTFPKGTYLILE